MARFLNSDGFVSTGQDLTGNNMFAYCGNNPVNRIDHTGQSWSDIWEFITNAVAEVGRTIEKLSPMYVGCTGAAVADGPLPIGDVIALASAAVITIGALGYELYHAAKAPPMSHSKAEEKEEAIAVPLQPKKQAFFPISPYDFKPKGLIKVEHTGSTNGRIFEWRDPITQIKIFEWDEDFRYGSHYHTMLIEWNGTHYGPHYLPGTPVPEPWNSIYFGG